MTVRYQDPKSKAYAEMQKSDRNVRMAVYWPNKKMAFAAYFKTEAEAMVQMEYHFANYRRMHP